MIVSAASIPRIPLPILCISVCIAFLSLLGLIFNREELADEGGYPLFTRAKIAMAGQIKLAAV